MQHLSNSELKQTAANYEKLMVPALFTPWAEQLLDASGFRPGHRLLDVACGTGIVARTAAQRAGASSSSIIGLDPNPGMLSVARGAAPELDWREGAAETLPFDDQSFDIVTSQFGLMFFEDRQAALREMQRVVAPGGCLVVSVFDDLANIPGYRAMAEIVEQVAGEDVAAILQMPFSLGDAETLKTLCSDSGLSNAEVMTRGGTARFPDSRIMVLADVKGWFPLADISLDNEQIDEIVRRLDSALAAYRAPDGSLSFPMPAHLIVMKP